MEWQRETRFLHRKTGSHWAGLTNDKSEQVSTAHSNASTIPLSIHPSLCQALTVDALLDERYGPTSRGARQLERFRQVNQQLQCKAVAV